MSVINKAFNYGGYRREIFAVLVISVISILFVYMLHLSPIFLLYVSIGFIILVLLINYPYIAILIDLVFVFILVGLSATLYSGWSYKAFTFMCLLSLFINRMYTQKRITFGSSADILLLLGYVIFIILSCIVNNITNVTDYIIQILTKYTLAFLIINLIETRKLLIIYLLVFVAIGTMNNIVGILQVILRLDWYGFGPRAIGFLVNPNGMGYLQAQLIPFIFILMLQTKNKSQRIVLMILFFLCPITAILSQSRGATIATLIVMAGIFLVSIRNYFVFVVIIIASVAVALFWQEPYTERLRSTFERKSLLEESRGYLYLAAATMIIEHPVFGVGPGKFGDEFVSTYAGKVNAPFRHKQVPHNGYLEVMTYSGIPGMLFILSLIGLWIRRFLREAKRAKKDNDFNTSQICTLMVISIIGFLVVAMFETLTEVKNFYYFMGINVAVTAILANERQQREANLQKINPEKVLKNHYPQASENT